MALKITPNVSGRNSHGCANGPQRTRSTAQPYKNREFRLENRTVNVREGKEVFNKENSL